MKIVFLSNFFNHHQKPLSDEFYRILGDEYHFISTTEMPQERLKMDYPVLTASYVKYTYKSKSEKEECINLINSADVVIFGSASPSFLKKRKRKGKLIFAYLNESMNSACAVVANGDIGSVPFMIQDGVNGLVYKNGDFEDFVSKVKMILDDEEKRKLLQINAYKTMIDIWNPKVAAERFVKFSESVILRGIGRNFDAGPCSVALPQKRF